jgi:hypothetical protein
LLSGRKVSIFISDPDIIKVLDTKTGKGEKTIFINEALRFYLDNAKNIAEINTTLGKMMELLNNGVAVQDPSSQPKEEITQENPVETMLLNSFSNFLPEL